MESRTQFRLRTLCRLIPLAFVALVMLTTINPQSLVARGKNPPPDFVITTQHQDIAPDTFVSTGLIEGSGTMELQYSICEWDGIGCVLWGIYRFQDPESEQNYFEIILPIWADRRIDYHVQVTAGPDGFLANGVLNEGTFAEVIGSAARRWAWDYDASGNRYRYEYNEWTLDGFLIP